MDDKHRVGRKPFFKLLCIEKLNMLRRKLIQLELTECWYKMQTDDLLIPFIATRSYLLLIHTEPIIKVLCYRMLRPNSQGTLFLLLGNLFELLNCFLLCVGVQDFSTPVIQGDTCDPLSIALPLINRTFTVSTFRHRPLLSIKTASLVI